MTTLLEYMLYASRNTEMLDFRQLSEIKDDRTEPNEAPFDFVFHGIHAVLHIICLI
ncbi:hypothetical protein COCNU_08G006140 [Cocos nucifera]|uniref:Uncharacterized protein n=1 Tax=Cocos nucifera TaxID=13894 RepID=A0A8K0IHR3_COCNU|nr:hypothetical protein COCNU_08G006140 [Cocos nucifera]